jgi:glycolate oxidase iron-sulfur subunit
MRRNIDAWWPSIEQGIEAIISTASGCGAELKEYGYALRHDEQYRMRAQRVTDLVRDISEVLLEEIGVTLDEQRLTLQSWGLDHQGFSGKVAFHSPCSLQHGLLLRGGIEQLLRATGAELTAVADSHLCCGSAGTYSLLQSQLAQQLKTNKLAALKKGSPTVILTANIGCQLHLARDEETPVRHWVEWLDALLPVREKSSQI